MDINEFDAQIKRHPDYQRVAMILIHNGVVRGTSRDLRPGRGLSVKVDRDKLVHVIATHKTEYIL